MASNNKKMSIHYSSKSNEWDTPQDFYNKLNARFSFTLDPCCTPESAKCSNYYTEEDDGLSRSWAGETVFMNPPYGRQISKWIKKAYEESQHENTTVVCLIPSRTDTKYWHDYCMKAHEVCFIKGRLRFGNPVTNAEQNPAPFPSAIVVFRAGYKPVMGGGNYPKIHALKKTGEYSYEHLC